MRRGHERDCLVQMTDMGACVPPPGQTPLRRRVLNAGGWTFAGYGLSVAIRFGSSLLLTRLLVPEMFGVMAIATVVMIGLAMFSDFGLAQSVVRSERGGEPLFLNTAWAVQILRGILLWLVALVVSALLVFANHIGIALKGSVYADPILPYVVIAILSISALFDGIQFHEGLGGAPKSEPAPDHTGRDRQPVDRLVLFVRLGCL